MFPPRRRIPCLKPQEAAPAQCRGRLPQLPQWLAPVADRIEPQVRLLHTATVLFQGNRHKPVIRIRVRLVTHRAKDALVTKCLQRVKLLLTGLRAGLNLNIVVASQTGTGRNQLTDNDVLLSKLFIKVDGVNRIINAYDQHRKFLTEEELFE